MKCVVGAPIRAKDAETRAHIFDEHNVSLTLSRTSFIYSHCFRTSHRSRNLTHPHRIPTHARTQQGGVERSTIQISLHPRP